MSERYIAKVSSITTDVDRYGRFFPIIRFCPVNPDSTCVEIEPVSLLSLSDVVKNHYSVGDDVEIKIDGKIPTISRVLNHNNQNSFINYDEIDFNYCEPCKNKIVTGIGQFYCQDTTRTCPKITNAIFRYACRRDVLDLPLSTMLENLLFNEISMSLPDALFLDEEQLIEGGFYDPKRGRVIASILIQRKNQLFGYNCSRDITLLAQERALDALSITGLYSYIRAPLVKKLRNGSWDWNSLPDVLTDPLFLRSCGISPNDVKTVVESAKSRVSELDVISRSF